MVKTLTCVSLLLYLFIFSSCTGTKRLKETKNAEIELSKELALTNIKDSALSFNYFNASGGLNIRSPFFNGGANAKFRIIRDSVIFVSISKLGFEVARVYITKDSIQALERIQKTFIKTTFKEASEKIGFNIDYTFIEDYLIGKPYIHEESNEISFQRSDTIDVFPELEDFFIQHSFTEGDYLLRKTELRDVKTKVEAKMEYTDYKEIDEGQNFSYLRHVSMNPNTDQEAEISIEFSKPEINVEKLIKFVIPKNYTPRAF